jgi:predicted transcriptional regulator
MRSHPTIGDQELKVLQWIQGNTPATVRDVTDGIGAELGLARTTVLTILERLRKKGYLIREKNESSFEYQPTQLSSEIPKSLMSKFFHKTLGGTLSPFVAHLAESENISSAEIEELRQLLNEIDDRRKDS